jgi:hypothetical protein
MAYILPTAQPSQPPGSSFLALLREMLFMDLNNRQRFDAGCLVSHPSGKECDLRMAHPRWI